MICQHNLNISSLDDLEISTHILKNSIFINGQKAFDPSTMVHMRDRVVLLGLVVTPFLVLGPTYMTAPKFSYGLLVLIFAIHILFKEDWATSKFRYVFISAFLLVTLVLTATIVGLAKKNSFESLTTAFNVLIPALWLITIPYASNKVSREFLLKVIYFLGFFASIVTFYKWSALRGYLNFSFDVKPFDSDWNIFLILIVTLFLWGRFGKKEKTLYFSILLFSILLSMLSGTRTLIYVYGYVVILSMFFLKKQIFQIFTICFSFILAFYFLFPVLSDPLQRRYLDLASQFTSIGFFQYIYGFDASTNLRHIQREYYKSIWLENTFFGTGIGQSTAQANLVADTPYAFLAQFGLFGAFFLVFILSYLLVSTGRSIRGRSLEDAKMLALYLMCLFPVSIAYNWTLHKSFWLSLSCLLGYALNKEDKPKKIGHRV